MSDEKVDQLLDRIADQVFPDDGVFGGASRISESAFYDFAEHIYLMEPQKPDDTDSALEQRIFETVLMAIAENLPGSMYGRSVGADYGGPYYKPEGGIDRFQFGISDHWLAANFISSDFFEALEEYLDSNIQNMPSWSSPEGEKLLRALAEALKAYFLDIELLEFEPSSESNDPAADAKAAFIEYMNSTDDVAAYGGIVLRAFASGAPVSGDLSIYKPGSFNFGLQPVFRQVWRPLGVQTGEIVKTLPLGPKQTERLSFKNIRRFKSTTSSETVSVSESTDQSSTGTKDSSEVVLEAAKSKQYSVSAEASFGMAGFGGSVAASTSGASSQSSKDAKSLLNETMVQTSSKLQRTSKIVVTTESESTSEFESTTEITNSNDEIAVTYVYSKLQRQYEISTFLAELNTVVYVAEDVPSWYQLTLDWFRRHASVLKDALLDRAFMADLDRVAWSSRPTEYPPSQIIQSGLSKLADNATNYATTFGTPPDPMAPLAERYETQLNQHRESVRLARLHEDSFRRLREHVWSHRLHYCRAIWMSEDAESRMLRFRDIEVPTRWFAQWLEPTYDSNLWKFVASSKRTRLSEMVDPTGPIGFSGNYAVYRMRQRTEWSTLLELLDDIRLPYLRVATAIDWISDDSQPRVSVQAIPGPALLDTTKYRCNIEDGIISVARIRQNGEDSPSTYSLPPEGGTVRVGNDLKLIIGGLDDQSVISGQKFLVRIEILPELEDPELKSIRWTEDLPSTQTEPQVFTPELLRRMTQFMQDLDDVLQKNYDWESLDAEQKSAVRTSYHEYLMHRDHTRRLLLDTDNLILSRIVDQTSSMEPFKAAHRYIDALSAAASLKQQESELQRLSTRVEAGDLSDPDIDKVVIVKSDDVDPSIDVD